LKLTYDYQRINFYILVAIVVAYPFSIKVCNFLILVLMAHWLLMLATGKISWANAKLFVICMMPFPFTVISLLYSANLHEGMHVIEKQMPFLIFPVVLGTIPAFSPSQGKLLMRTFCWIALGSFLVFLGFAVKGYWQSGDSNVFYWMNLTNAFSFHPSYYALFISFSAFYLLLEDETFNITLKKIFILGAAAGILLMLSSKIHIVLFIAILFILILINSLKGGWIKTMGFALVLTVLILAVASNEKVRERFYRIDTLSYHLNDPPATFNELTIRFALVECSWKVIRTNVLFGVGAGDVPEALDKVYREYDYKFGYMDQQNPHNEYLSIWLGTGMIGLLAFLILFGFSLYNAIYSRNYAHLIFLLLFAVSFLFESVLERQKGIVLFSMFNSFFLFHGQSMIKKRYAEQAVQ
jgi:O-antigen ligase